MPLPQQTSGTRLSGHSSAGMPGASVGAYPCMTREAEARWTLSIGQRGDRNGGSVVPSTAVGGGTGGGATRSSDVRGDGGGGDGRRRRRHECRRRFRRAARRGRRGRAAGSRPSWSAASAAAAASSWRRHRRRHGDAAGGAGEIRADANSAASPVKPDCSAPIASTSCHSPSNHGVLACSPKPRRAALTCSSRRRVAMPRSTPSAPTSMEAALAAASYGTTNAPHTGRELRDPKLARAATARAMVSASASSTALRHGLRPLLGRLAGAALAHRPGGAVVRGGGGAAVAAGGDQGGA